MKKNLDIFVKIVFFGSIWGILEATLGYVLHFVPGYISGSVMFPIVLFILYRAYKALGSKWAIFYVAFVAMAIKSVNLLLPYLYPAKTINPMVAMFLEASLVFAVIPMIDHKKLSYKVTGIIMASLLWRVAYIGYQGVNFLITDYLSNYLQSFSLSFEFVVLYGLIGTVLSVVLMTVTERYKWTYKIDQLKVNPLVSFGLLIVAVVLTLNL
jgi:hypothetical protein